MTPMPNAPRTPLKSFRIIMTHVSFGATLAPKLPATAIAGSRQPNARTPTRTGRFSSGESRPAMPTFASTAPITEQVMRALIVLRHARRDGNASRIYVATEQLRRKLDALPAPARTLAEIDPELDTRLRVSFA